MLYLDSGKIKSIRITCRECKTTVTFDLTQYKKAILSDCPGCNKTYEQTTREAFTQLLAMPQLLEAGLELGIEYESDLEAVAAIVRGLRPRGQG
jgi:hypothetical protein